jgi:hypothetical protein
MKIKTALRFHLTPAKMATTKKTTANASKDVERRNP